VLSRNRGRVAIRVIIKSRGYDDPIGVKEGLKYTRSSVKFLLLNQIKKIMRNEGLKPLQYRLKCTKHKQQKTQQSVVDIGMM
jgi:hypothetical protein